MLKQKHEQIQLLVRTVDVIVCCVAFFGAFWIRQNLAGFANVVNVGKLESFGWILAASLSVHLIIYPWLGFYQSLRLKSLGQLIGMVGKAGLIEFFVLGSLVFIFQEKDTSRLFFGVFLTLNYLLVLAEKVGARILLSSVRRRGYNFRRVLIIGTGLNAESIVKGLLTNQHWGYVPIGILTAPSESGRDICFDLPVLGTHKDLAEVIRAETIDEVYYAPDQFTAGEIQESAGLCEELGLPFRMSLNLFDLRGSQVTFSEIGRIPVVTFYTTLMTPMGAVSKRFIDIIVSMVGLGLTAILYPWIAYRIRKESPGPVIFKQIRVGENGRKFRCYKFRTMYMDAEEKKQELIEQNEMQGPMFKIKSDPRVFEFGRFLRRSSLDELPQFLNIIRGDMSVVGTRPPTPDEVSCYKATDRRRLSIRPGLTGLWQVEGRNSTSDFSDIVSLDLQYIDNWSLWKDIKIIWRTIWVALSRKGAY